MKTREKAIIGMIAGLTAVSIIIGGCYTDETPEFSSFSSDLIQDTDNTSESVLESDASVSSEATESSSLISQTETSVTEKDTEESNKNTAGNENSSSPTKQTEQDSSNSESASSGQSSSSSSTGTQPTATSTPKPTENVSSGSSNTATATSTPIPTATPTPVPTATPTPEPTATPTPKPVWGWKNAKGTIKTTYDSATNGSNIPIEIPNMPVSGETCDGKLTGYGKVTDATEEAVWNYLDNKFGEDFCGVGHLKVVDGSVH